MRVLYIVLCICQALIKLFYLAVCFFKALVAALLIAPNLPASEYVSFFIWYITIIKALFS